MGISKSALEKIKGWYSGEKSTADLKRGESEVSSTATGYHPYSSSGFDNLSNTLRLETSMMQRYADYEEMDDYPEISSALDIYADDGTVPDSLTGNTVSVKSKSDEVNTLLNTMLHNSIKIDEEIWAITRTLAKYGNAYAELLVDETGVLGVNVLPSPTVRRIETKKGSLLGFVQDNTGKFNVEKETVKKALKDPAGPRVVKGSQTVIFEPSEVIHWRLRGKDLGSEYGHSILDSARWIWRRLVMAEDSALVYKLTRSPSRFAFYVDVGDLPSGQAMAYVNQVKQQFKKKKLFNPNTGKLDFRINPLAPDEDFFIPTRGGQESTRVEIMQGADAQSVADLKYFRDKLFSALKVPRSYLGAEGTTNRASLAQEDVRFARTVMRIQREIRNGIKRMCRVHLAINGIDPETVSFDIKMSSPSSIFEMAQIELRNAQADNARSLLEFYPKSWVMERVFDIPKEEAERLIDQKRHEASEKMKAYAQQQLDLKRDFPQVDPATLPVVEQMEYRNTKPSPQKVVESNKDEE
ncbi:hypothetical protein CL629_02360 [bacterium]|nr:hypothetical protein [bacterium]|tara:strand:- start:5562 stop:7133 length:1572 start_codon:yes stop_codon:yes gene_type:complete